MGWLLCGELTDGGGVGGGHALDVPAQSPTVLTATEQLTQPTRRITASRWGRSRRSAARSPSEDAERQDVSAGLVVFGHGRQHAGQRVQPGWSWCLFLRAGLQDHSKDHPGDRAYLSRTRTPATSPSYALQDSTGTRG